MTLTNLARRALPALLMTSSVTLLSAGIFNWAPPQSSAQAGSPSLEPGDPNFDMTPLPQTPTPDPSVASPTPGFSLVLPSGIPYPSHFPSSSASPGLPPTSPTPPGSVVSGDSLPTRIVVPSLGIDLPVIVGDTGYPLCNVAQYLLGFSNPGQAGTTYLYGHARAGMFLPLLEESEDRDGRGMIGALVKLYTADLKLHMYQIEIVKRHATDLTLAYDMPAGQHRLIMQTSEGPHGTIPKLQVAAKPIGIFTATAADALPDPKPKVCS